MKNKCFTEVIENISDLLWLSKYTGIEINPKNIEKHQNSNEKEDNYPNNQRYRKLYYETDVFDNNDSLVNSAELSMQKINTIHIKRIPKKRLLDSKKNIIKSIKNINKKSRSISLLEIDEDKTVSKIADEGIFDIVFIEKKKKYYSLYLIIDLNNTMSIWNDQLQDFIETVSKAGVFLCIWTYYLDSSLESSIIYKDIGKTKSIEMNKLIIGNKRDIIWVTSDCLGNTWKNGDIYSKIKSWTEYSFTSIIQMFPQRMWMGTALYKTEQIQLFSRVDNPLNKNLTFEYEDKSQNNLKIPVLTMDDLSIKAYSDILNGSLASYINGIIVEKGQDFSEINITSLELSADARIKRFYSQASPLAQKIAFSLSALPVDYNLLLILQEEMFPESNHSHIVEVILGGIIEKKEINNVIRYEFYPGVRSKLNSNISALDSLNIFNQMLPYMSNSKIQNLGLEKILLEPQSLFQEIDISNDETKEQLYLILNNLKRLGGSYYKSAILIDIHYQEEKTNQIKLKNINQKKHKEELSQELQEDIINGISEIKMDKFDNYEFKSHHIHSDDNLVTIRAYSTPENIEIISIIEGDGEYFELSISFELECTLEFNIFKADYYGEDNLENYSITEDLNNHYLSVEDECLLGVECIIKVKFEEENFLNEISISSIENIEIIKKDRDNKVEEKIDKSELEIEGYVISSIKENFLKLLSETNIKELDSYILQDDPRFIEQEVRISSMSEYIPKDIKIIDIEEKNSSYIVNVSFDINTYLELYMHKDDFYSDKNIRNNSIPYVNMNDNDFVIKEINCLINLSVKYNVLVDGINILELGFIEVLDSEIKEEFEKENINESGGNKFYCENCSRWHTFSCNSLDWEVVDTNNRQMGFEKHHTSSFEMKCNCGEDMSITFHCWEYPLGVIDNTDVESKGIKGLSNLCYPTLYELDEDSKLNNDDTYILESLKKYAEEFIGKSLQEILDINQLHEIKHNLEKYKKRRKGYLGNLAKELLFKEKLNEIENLGVNIKTMPIKKLKNGEFRVKERLILSMVDYHNIIHEKWETSNLLEKNRLSLILFFHYEEDKTLLEYKFLDVAILNLNDLNTNYFQQINKDWSIISSKIKRGEAHLLSGPDTKYLSTVTKGANGKARRTQPNSNIEAKPRAFCIKSELLNKIYFSEYYI